MSTITNYISLGTSIVFSFALIVISATQLIRGIEPQSLWISILTSVSALWTPSPLSLMKKEVTPPLVTV